MPWVQGGFKGWAKEESLKGVEGVENQGGPQK